LSPCSTLTRSLSILLLLFSITKTESGRAGPLERRNAGTHHGPVRARGYESGCCGLGRVRPGFLTRNLSERVAYRIRQGVGAYRV
jgi:hypothetical protein